MGTPSCRPCQSIRPSSPRGPQARETTVLSAGGISRNRRRSRRTPLPEQDRSRPSRIARWRRVGLPLLALRVAAALYWVLDDQFRARPALVSCVDGVREAVRPAEFAATYAASVVGLADLLVNSAALELALEPSQASRSKGRPAVHGRQGGVTVRIGPGGLASAGLQPKPGRQLIVERASTVP